MDKDRQSDLRTLPVAEQAAAWFLRFDQSDLSGETRRAFVAWLKEAPNHIEEFLQVSALHQELSDAPEKFAAIDELVTEARANVVDILETKDQSPVLSQSRKRNWRLTAAAGVAASIVAMVTIFVFVVPTEPSKQHFQTAFGEQRSIVLDDDSMIVLNTESSLTIEYTASSRAAILHAGEALFEVSKDPDRPFTVDAGPLAIRVLGTTFNVYRQAEQTVLTVVEGEVSVATGDAGGETVRFSAIDEETSAAGSGDIRDSSARPLQVTAGQQVAVAVNGAVAREPQANLEQATAWTERRLVFDNERLAHVFDEFNRYNHRRVLLDVPQLAERRITGVFDARDIDTLLGFVEGQPGVRVERREGEIRIVATE